MKCDNAMMGHQRRIISPQCYNSPPTQHCTITYTCGSMDTEQDTLDLCDKCAELVRADCQRHGYKFESRKIGGGEGAA